MLLSIGNKPGEFPRHPPEIPYLSLTIREPLRMNYICLDRDSNGQAISPVPEPEDLLADLRIGKAPRRALPRPEVVTSRNRKYENPFNSSACR